MNTFEHILSHLENGQAITLKSHYHADEITREISASTDAHTSLSFVASGEGYCLTETFLPKPRLIVLGGGHISLPLVEMAAKVGFDPIVYDDRSAFANKARFPAATQVICDDFAHLARHITLLPTDYVCVLTRGHQHDILCLTTLFQSATQAFYLGMIGSKRRIAVVKHQVLQADARYADQLNTLHAPIGLPIGAMTPEEIAVSILAELIQKRRKHTDGNTFRGECTADMDLLRHLVENPATPSALVTILSTKGSTPRHSGAKMLICASGTIVGSIGGGCTEAEVIQIARDVLDVGGFRHMILDLADKAEELGMVCGGSMEILIEKI